MLDIKELRKYLEEATSDEYIYDENEYIIHYDTESEKILTEEEINSIINKYMQVLNVTLIDKLPEIDYLAIELPIKQVIYTLKDTYLTIHTRSVKGIDPDGYFKSSQRYDIDYRDSTRIIFYDSCDVVQKLITKNRYIPTRFDNEIDYMHPLESPILKTKAFRIIKDLKLEKLKYTNAYSKSFTYNDVLKHKTRNEFLLAKWKNVTSLQKYMNINKLTYQEILFFGKIKPRLTEKAFLKLLEWFKQYRKTYKTTDKDVMFFLDTLINEYILDKLKLINLNHQITLDICNMTWEMKKQIELNFKSPKGLINYHNAILEEYNSTIALKKSDKTEYKLKPKWKDIHNKLNEHLDIDVLNSAYKLTQEGINMSHCVGSYAASVKSGKSYIFSISYGDEPYTCELIIQKDKIKINQLYGRFNKVAPNELRNIIERIIADAIIPKRKSMTTINQNDNNTYTSINTF